MLQRLTRGSRALAGIPEAMAAVRGERSDIPALTFDGTEIPRLDPARRLEPIDDLDTLIELCSRLVENPAPLDDVDRCVDAISRLCDRRPIDFYKRTSAARSATATATGRTPQHVELSAAVVRCGRARLAHRRGTGSAAVRQILGAGCLHFRRGCSALRGESPARRPLPCSRHQRTRAAGSTRESWWRGIASDARLPIASEPADLILALLRLAPDHRSAALADAGDLEGERGAAIRHALGAEGEKIGPSAALWVAAARARSPWADDPDVEARHPRLGPDAGRAAAYHIESKQLIRRDDRDGYLRIDREPALAVGTSWMPELPTVSFHCTRWFFTSAWPSPGSLWPIALGVVLRNRGATVGRGKRGFFRLAGHARNRAPVSRPGCSR